jgi:hypothetical protein
LVLQVQNLLLQASCMRLCCSQLALTGSKLLPQLICLSLRYRCHMLLQLLQASCLRLCSRLRLSQLQHSVHRHLALLWPWLAPQQRISTSKPITVLA